MKDIFWMKTIVTQKKADKHDFRHISYDALPLNYLLAMALTPPSCGNACSEYQITLLVHTASVLTARLSANDIHESIRIFNLSMVAKPRVVYIRIFEEFLKSIRAVGKFLNYTSNPEH